MLQACGFDLHEEMSATSYFPTLGGLIGGLCGLVRTSQQRYWNLKLAFEDAANRPVSSDLVQRLLGHAMVVLVLNRAGISVFRSLYDFAGPGVQPHDFVGVSSSGVFDFRRTASPPCLQYESPLEH